MAWIRPYVRQCGDERRPAWRLPNRALLDYLLVYIAEGTGVFEIASRRYEAAAGDLFWIPPATVHTMEGYPPSMVCPYVHFDLVYRPGASDWNFSIPSDTTDLRRFKALMHPRVTHPAFARLCGKLDGHTNRRVGQLIRDVCAEAARAQPHAQLRMSGIMVEVIAELLRGQDGIRHAYGQHAAALEEVADFISEHCEGPLRMGELAGVAGLSPSHFRKVFGLHFGQSPRQFQRRARIQKAKELMLGSSLNVSQVSEMVGFATVHSFSRAFGAVEGIPPSAFRTRDGLNTWSSRHQLIADGRKHPRGGLWMPGRGATP
jgi:AraC-like DNA-binding protein